MGLFGRASQSSAGAWHATGGLKADTRQALMREVVRTGGDAQFKSGPEGQVLVMPGGARIPVEGLYAAVAETPADQRADLIRRWVADARAQDAGAARARQGADTRTANASPAAEPNRQQQPEALSAAELRQHVHTLLGPAAMVNRAGFPYARSPFPGVEQVLCLVYPNQILPLTGDSIDRLALSLDELFAAGQANVDALPTDPPEPLGDPGLTFITGPSEFVASKAANIAALVAGPIGPAPHGLFFAVPNYNSVACAVIMPGWGRAFAHMIRAAVLAADQAAQAHTRVSPLTYYWAPDGTVEQVTSVREGGPLEERIYLDRPCPAFDRYVGDTVAE
ncbi:MAG: hypothetical protein LBD77_04770 [Bifidobacteriaceae bacterium]|jgi:hypothetical protein|nr:hypothetical protein [Bifidobacteriaceae bacterium]